MTLIRQHNFGEYIPSAKPDENSERLLRGEWLVTNGLGGYSSSSVAGITTRKYHALLVAALPPPHGRTIMLNHLSEELILPNGKRYLLGCEEKANGNISLEGMSYLKNFHLEDGLPVWRFEIEEVVIEKRLLLIYRQNTVQIIYRLVDGPYDKIRLRLEPSVHFRMHEAPVNLPIDQSYVVTAVENRYEISFPHIPPLRLFVHGERSRFTLDGHYSNNVFFRWESNRGYESIGHLWSPGYFKVDVSKDKQAALIASTENWEIIKTLAPEEAIKAEHDRRNLLLKMASEAAKSVMGSELVLAADQFIITPESRVEDAVRAHASGDEVRTIIAGYHWFTDWGRDTMISLEGLTLCTGREHEALWILKTFNHYVRDGLIPNMFPEGKNEGLYHTADATLWFFHAIDRYLALTHDLLILKQFMPTLKSIIDYHLKGTRFGIGVDPNDNLLKQGAEGYQLTWMDAKVGDWVVTPRRGKAVEINALWYNALCLMQEWAAIENVNDDAALYSKLAQQTRQSFNNRFWNSAKNYLFDVVDGEKGNDDALRPNQLFAISLKYPVLDEYHWKPVVDICKKELLTPFGLRSLGPEHPDYKSRYYGDLRSRDAAYHQGTVWAWLIGPFIDAWLKVYPDEKQKARSFLEDFEKHLEDAGVGSINEVFDASEPYHAQGCIAQAWSVAEVLRCWLKTQ